MKKIFLMFVLVSLNLFTSCKNEEVVGNVQFKSPSIDEVLKEMDRVVEQHNSSAKFSLLYEDGVYIIDEIIFVQETFEESFSRAWDAKGQVGVVVECNGGGAIFCPDGENQGGCVGSAVAGCLNSGGVATVYRAKTVSADM
ncbi:MAG: hypothetical protein Q4B43_06450 [Bacteroidota bacterium]|nr:hypothetical protein [Bacteroidota bacterium]